jgi:hypothetical protein
MPVNTDINSPTIRPGVAFDADLSPSTLRAIDVLADGTLFVEDVTGNITSYSFVGVTSFERLVLQVRRIIGDGAGSVGDGSTGTDIALANLRPLH